jgi:hypothetical protein
MNRAPVLLGGAMAVIVLGIVWPWTSLRGTQGSITFGHLRTSEGDNVEVVLTLCNRLPWAVWGLAVRLGEVHGAGHRHGAGQ